MHDAEFEALYERTAADLRRYVAGRVGPAGEVDDVVADVFLVAWRRRSTVPLSEEDARRWLWRVAANVVRNTRRAAGRRTALLMRVATTEVRSLPVDPGPGEALDALLRWEALGDADRQVLAFAAAGLRGEALAAVLGGTANAAASRLSRARRALRGAEAAAEDP